MTTISPDSASLSHPCGADLRHAPSAAELADLTTAYARDGFVAGGVVLNPDQVLVLRAELDRVLTDRDQPGRPQPYRLSAMGQRDAPIWQIVDIWLASAAYAALLRQPRLVAMAKTLLRCERLRLWHDQIQFKPAGGGGVNWWHQDWPYWQVVGPAEEVLTAWIALDDADADNGCMSMVPGSQRWGNCIDDLHAVADGRPDHNQHSFCAGLPRAISHKATAEEIRGVLRPVAAGHVHFHHAFTWHGSHANPSGRPRRAIALHLLSDRAVTQASAHPHLKSPELPPHPGQPITGCYFPECG